MNQPHWFRRCTLDLSLLSLVISCFYTRIPFETFDEAFEHTTDCVWVMNPRKQTKNKDWLIIWLEIRRLVRESLCEWSLAQLQMNFSANDFEYRRGAHIKCQKAGCDIRLHQPTLRHNQIRMTRNFTLTILDKAEKVMSLNKGRFWFPVNWIYFSSEETKCQTIQQYL